MACGHKHYHGFGHWTCELAEGHAGRHQEGGTTWGKSEYTHVPEAPTRETRRIQHTPGPWTWTKEPSPTQPCHVAYVVRGETEFGNAIVSMVFANPELTVLSEGNARLIAAAPDLLEAGRLVLARWESGDLAEAVRLLGAAAAKAEGR